MNESLGFNKMDESLGFKIRHLSFRDGRESMSFRDGEAVQGVGWIDVNLVFQVEDEYRMYADNASQEWVSGVLYEVDEAKQIIQFYESRAMGVLNREKHPALRRGLVMNDDYCLNWLPRFEVYRFHEIVEDNGITRAAINELIAMRDGVAPTGRFVSISRLMRCIRTLNTFWD